MPSNSPASGAEFEHGQEEQDGYKNDVRNEKKMKDLDYVANGKNVKVRSKEKDKTSQVNWLDIHDEKGKGRELLRFLQQKEQKFSEKDMSEQPKQKAKPKTEVNCSSPKGESMSRSTCRPLIPQRKTTSRSRPRPRKTTLRSSTLTMTPIPKAECHPTSGSVLTLDFKIPRAAAILYGWNDFGL